jgi:chorismate dehydratase
MQLGTPIIAVIQGVSAVMRIGAVNYLNSKPLVYGLEAAAPGDRLLFDLPSRLADSLSEGRLDVALIPSVEWLRQPGHTIVSDACVACRGPVYSVKLYFRVPPSEVKMLALDEGSRTSAALAQVLLDRLASVRPETMPLPIGCGLESTAADAVLLIGDRAILADDRDAVEVWDLGEKWLEVTGLPFVFAAWVARPDVEVAKVEPLLSAARDRGVAHLAEIAAAEAPPLGIDVDLAFHYLRDNLHFTLGEQEFAGLEQFARLCAERGFVPKDAVRGLTQMTIFGCEKQ